MNESSPDDSRLNESQPRFVVELRNVSKSFSGVRVLRGVSLEVGRGEVHALTGENGAGKSTLMKILAGLYAPDSGELFVNGRRMAPGNPHAALKAGVAMIYQELLPFLDLTIAENIFMGQEPASPFFGWIDKRAMRRRAGALLRRLGVHLSPTRKMRELRVAEMQSVEIAKAVAHQAQVIVMDEPTSALSEPEAEALFRMIAELRQQGTAIIYISHKLEEIFRLADRVTVLRDGTCVATQRVREVTPDRLIEWMVGRGVQPVVPTTLAQKSDTALSVRGLYRAGRFSNITLSVRRGEILGLAGLMGAGRTDLVNALYGFDPAERGEIRVGGKPVRIRKPAHAIAAGIGLVSEDRKLFGVVPTLGVRSNVTLAALRRWCRAGVIRRRAEIDVAREQVRLFAIKTASLEQPLEHLSGGNQQKVVLARTLLNEPNILLLDEPTRGIDIAAKNEVHLLVARLAASGKAIILVSSEMPELFALSHRLLVMRQGEITAEFETQHTTPQEVLKFAIPQ